MCVCVCVVCAGVWVWGLFSTSLRRLAAKRLSERRASLVSSLQQQQQQQQSGASLDLLLTRSPSRIIIFIFCSAAKGDKGKRVLKMILVDDMSAIQEALDEAKKLITLRHPNIVRYIDVFLHQELIGDVLTNDYVCICMEFCPGGCLRDYMESDDFVPLSPLQILDCFQQVCLGVLFTHGMNIVHTDLKLENIMVCFGDGGRLILKIGDYGLAVMNRSGVAGSGPSGVASPPTLRAPRRASPKLRAASRGEVRAGDS